MASGKGYIIPDRFLAAGLVLFIASLFFAPAPLGRLADGLLGGFGVALGLLAVVTVLEKRMGREAMGGGDLKLLHPGGGGQRRRPRQHLEVPRQGL